VTRHAAGRSTGIVKRSVDLVASIVAVVLLSPILGAVATLIWASMGRPILYGQLRPGLHERPIRVWKFRTMTDARDGEGRLLPDGIRLTRVGRWLREWSLDELPQLINVLKGEMSLVGPRPFVIHESEQITGWASRRLETTPGITGLWQVLGRNDIPFEEMVKLDYVYVTNWSLWWDIKILVQTLPTVLNRRGAY
jgi:lipopolysaccharide/colanic/teichoic acid biosynthesis glycosyltransferase